MCLAEKREVSIDDIARVGGWAMVTLKTTYLSALPRKSMWLIAGHPKKKGFFCFALGFCHPRHSEGSGVSRNKKKMVR